MVESIDLFSAFEFRVEPRQTKRKETALGIFLLLLSSFFSFFTPSANIEKSDESVEEEEEEVFVTIFFLVLHIRLFFF